MQPEVQTEALQQTLLRRSYSQTKSICQSWSPRINFVKLCQIKKLASQFFLLMCTPKRNNFLLTGHKNSDLFRFSPQYVITPPPQLQMTRHYIAIHYVKIRQVRPANRPLAKLNAQKAVLHGKLSVLVNVNLVGHNFG